MVAWLEGRTDPWRLRLTPDGALEARLHFSLAAARVGEAHRAAGAVVGAGLAPRLQEHVMQEVLGLAPIAEHALAHGEHGRAVAIVQPRQRRPVSRGRRCDQGPVVLFCLHRHPLPRLLYIQHAGSVAGRLDASQTAQDSRRATLGRPRRGAGCGGG